MHCSKSTRREANTLYYYVLTKGSIQSSASTFCMHTDCADVTTYVFIHGCTLCSHLFFCICVVLCKIDSSCLSVCVCLREGGRICHLQLYHWLAAKGIHSWLCKSKIKILRPFIPFKHTLTKALSLTHTCTNTHSHSDLPWWALFMFSDPHPLMSLGKFFHFHLFLQCPSFFADTHIPKQAHTHTKSDDLQYSWITNNLMLYLFQWQVLL